MSIRIPYAIVLAALACGSAGCKHFRSTGDTAKTDEAGVRDAGLVELPSDIIRRRMERTAVSLIELIARPKEFSGKRVRVEGYLRMRDEDQMLYLSEESARWNLGSNSIAISAAKCGAEEEDSETVRKLERVAEGYVSITGRFMLGDANVLAFQAGSLCSIEQVEPVRAFEPAPSSSASR